MPARLPAARPTFQIRWPVIRRSIDRPSLFTYVTTNSDAVGGASAHRNPPVWHQIHERGGWSAQWRTTAGHLAHLHPAIHSVCERVPFRLFASSKVSGRLG